MSGRCEIDSAGRVTGPVAIAYNSPWPCRNGTPGGFESPAYGVVLHTEDGSEAGTRSWFNDSASEVSAFFSVSLEGSVMQYGPLTGWMAWSQAEGNSRWIGIEHEDGGDPAKPFTAAQMNATAHLTEVLSRHYGFPLADATDPFTQHGVTLHSEGGVPFGDHLSCPGTVRAAQRPDIIARAKVIRALGAPVTPKPVRAKAHTTAGLGNLAELAAANDTTPAAILQATAEQGAYPADITQWLDSIFSGAASATTPMQEGLKLYIPA